MVKLIIWLLSSLFGVLAWFIAANGENMSFWPKAGMMLLFWICLNLYSKVDNVDPKAY